MTFVAGIDMGAKSTKAVVLDDAQQIRGTATVKTRPDFAAVAREVLDLALQRAGIADSEINYIATTGFGRYNVPFRDVQITDITCRPRRGLSLPQDPLGPRHRRPKHPGLAGQRHWQSARVPHQ